MRMKQGLFADAARFLLLGALIVVIVVFGLVNPAFLSATNIMDILRTSSIILLMACGSILIWSTGEINFAVGAQLTLGGAVLGKLMSVLDPSFYPLGIVIALIAVGLTGLIAGVFVINLGVPSFIATLAISLSIDATNIVLTQNTTLFSSNWGSVYTILGQGYVFGIIPLPAVICLALAVGTHLFMNRTRTGNYIYAIGGNQTASRQVGVNVSKIKYIAFVLGSVLIGFAGILQTSINNNVLLTSGTDLLMPSICATVLGATFLTLGKYNVVGSAVAAVLIITLQNGVISCGGAFYMKDIVQGLVLLVAVGVIALVRKGALPSVKFES